MLGFGFRGYLSPSPLSFDVSYCCVGEKRVLWQRAAVAAESSHEQTKSS